MRPTSIESHALYRTDCEQLNEQQVASIIRKTFLSRALTQSATDMTLRLESLRCD